MAAAGKDLYEQGLAREQAGDVPGAFESFRRSAKADPRIAAPYVGLSRLLMRNHQRAEAIACLERAAMCEPSNAAIYTLLGQALAQDGQLNAARERFELALRHKPQSVGAAIGLALALEDLGERQEAVGVYRKLLEHSPGDGEALAGLLSVADGEALEQVIGVAKEALQHAPDRDAALIGYGLGKALARNKEHEAAFAAWSRANAARRHCAGAFDAAYFDQRIDRMIEIFSAPFFDARRGWGDSSDQPVFVIGLPRSGTTLTEQILAGHPSVYGAGELDVLTDMATGTPDRLGRPDPAWPEAAIQLQTHHAEVIARDHLARLNMLAPSDAQRVVDKQPLNFWHLGLVALTFPNARIVHCTRDIRDNGLSIFAENFTDEQRWATDLADIAQYWRGYRKLMAHWKRVSGLNILDVSYEDIVADIEGQSRKLTAFLGLPWDASVLSFHEAERAVQTPSRWQVRQPLYSSSVGRWRAYEARLAPLVRAAEGEDIR